MKYRIRTFTVTVIPREYSLKDKVKMGLNSELKNQVNNVPCKSLASRATPRGTSVEFGPEEGIDKYTLLYVK